MTFLKISGCIIGNLIFIFHFIAVKKFTPLINSSKSYFIMTHTFEDCVIRDNYLFYFILLFRL